MGWPEPGGPKLWPALTVDASRALKESQLSALQQLRVHSRARRRPSLPKARSTRSGCLPRPQQQLAARRCSRRRRLVYFGPPTCCVVLAGACVAATRFLSASSAHATTGRVNDEKERRRIQTAQANQTKTPETGSFETRHSRRGVLRDPGHTRRAAHRRRYLAVSRRLGRQPHHRRAIRSHLGMLQQHLH